MGGRRPKLKHSSMEAVIRESELHGWTWVGDGGSKIKGKCSCGRHMFSVSANGSSVDPHAAKNLRSTLSACKNW